MNINILMGYNSNLKIVFKLLNSVSHINKSYFSLKVSAWQRQKLGALYSSIVFLQGGHNDRALQERWHVESRS